MPGLQRFEGELEADALEGVILTGPIPTEIKLADEPEDKRKARTARILAHTGQPILNWSWAYGHLAIDLEGLDVGERPLPVLLDHRGDQRLGATQAIEKTKDGLQVDARFLRRSELAQDVLSELDDGFPWQSSIYAVPLKATILEEGQSAEVNGYELDGPAIIFRESVLREVSLCALGADKDTHAQALELAHGAGVSLALNHEPEKEPMPQKQTPPAETPAVPASPAPTTLAQLELAHPELVAELRQQIQSQERARVAAILGEADADQHELAAKLVNDGANEAEALKAILEDVRNRREDQLAQLRKGSEANEDAENDGAPVGPADDAELEAKNKARAELPLEERAKAEWDESAELRAEFGDFDAYLALCKNEDFVE